MLSPFSRGVSQRKAKGVYYSPLNGDPEAQACTNLKAKLKSKASSARKNIWGLLKGFAQAMTPRVWTATALDLAIARIMIAYIALDAIPWSVGHAQEQFSYNVEPEGRNMQFTYPVCGGLVSSFQWGRINISSYVTTEFVLLRLALWLSMLGVATPLSMAAAGVLVTRYKIITLGLQLSTGHWNDFMGPVILMLAFSPCGDVLSVDSIVSWARRTRAGWASSALRLTASPKVAVTTALQAPAYQAKQEPSVSYGISLMAVGIYIGVYILAAGLAKASSGPYPFLGWAFGDYVKGQMHLFWVRQGGEAYIPSLSSVGWNPLRLVTNSYIFPIFRVDKVPLILHIGNEIVMVWECLHWYFMLCAPAVRYLSVLCDVMFHMGVGMTLGIYQFYHLLAAHLIFLPWSYVIATPCAALFDLFQTKDSDDKSVLAPYPSPAKTNGEPGAGEGVISALKRRPRIVLACLVALFFISGQAFELIPRNSKFLGVQRRGVVGHCHPFDPAPGFGSQNTGKLAVWSHANANPSVVRIEGAIRTSAREMHFVHSDGDVSSMFLWEAICHMEGKKHCAVRNRSWLHDKVTYNKICCLQAAPHDPLGTFRNQLVTRFTQEKGGAINSKEFVDMWKMLSVHASVVPPSNATRSITAVVFSRPNKLKADPDAGWEAVISEPRTSPFNEKCESLVRVQPEIGLTQIVNTTHLPNRFVAMLKSCEYQPAGVVPVPAPEEQDR